jgi:hypothetical protein
MPLTSFSAVQNFIAQVLTTNGEAAGAAVSPHKDFWSKLTYDQFVNGNVPGVNDPATGNPIPILVKGDSANSNLILSLLGKGPLFDPNNGAFGQMPANGPPMFTPDQVKQLADWIDAGCPK